MTRFDHGQIHLSVGGRVENTGASSTAKAGLPHGAAALAQIGPSGPPNQQVIIEARIVEATGDQSLLGIEWWPGGDRTIAPVATETTTSGGSANRLPFTLSIGGGAGESASGHGPGCTCAQCAGSGGDVSTGVGVRVPISGGGKKRTTSILATFQGSGLIERLDQSYLVVMLEVGRTQDGKPIRQPVILPLIGTTDPGAVDKRQQADLRSDGTRVLVRDEATVIIGGLTSPKDPPPSKIPLLGNLPYLTKLFASKTDKSETNELLIFLTPRVIVDTGE
jgi:hypothetical protein